MRARFIATILVTALLAGPVFPQESENRVRETADALNEETKNARAVSTAVPTTPLLERAVDPDLYVLGPYDRLVIHLIGTETRSFTLPVLPEGDVLIPGMGAIRADGSTLSDFRRRLLVEVDRYFKNVRLFCFLETPRLFRVFVTGEVESPGAVDVSAVERVSDAIEKAGGLNKIGSSRFVLLDRGEEQRRIDLFRFIVRGEFESNPFLESGDRIHVPAGELHALITGRVRKQGMYEFAAGESVADLIELAGGLTSDAIADTILLTRFDGRGDFETLRLPASRLDTPLRDLDEIAIGDALLDGRRVFVTGAVSRTGRYWLGPGDGVRELLARAGRLEDLADPVRIVVERRNGEILRFSPDGSDGDIDLADGDIVNIPPIDRTVTVGGEVQLPGVFEYRNDWTVARYVGLAGGPTREGSVDRVIIYGADGGQRPAGRDDEVNRGDVIIVKRSRSRLFADLFKGIVTLGTVVISIVVLTK